MPITTTAAPMMAMKRIAQLAALFFAPYEYARFGGVQSRGRSCMIPSGENGQTYVSVRLSRATIADRHIGVQYSETMDQLRAFVYDRTSRIIDGRGTANADQAAENDRYCERQGWTIVGRFTDAGKGASRHSKSRRTDYERMVDGVQRGECDVLVVWEASRLHRDLAVYVALRDLCVTSRVLLCYNGQVYDMTRGADRFVTGLNALQAEYEADNIRDRVLRTTRANAERGRPHGRIPYGYRRVYDERTGALIEQVP